MTAQLWRWRFVPLIFALVLAGVASVAYAVGVTSGPPGDAAAAQGTTVPGHPELGLGWLGGGAAPGSSTAPGLNGMSSVPGQVDVSITQIDGSKLSLQTSDGWTRTIDAAGATVTKAGQTIAVGDLKIGDKISFRETRQSDGTYKIVSIQVILPTVSGTVSSKTSTTIVIKTVAGTTTTVNVTSATKYTVQGVKSPTLADVAVGSRIVAAGVLNTDGSLTAATVQANPVRSIAPGAFGSGIPGGPGHGRWPSGGIAPRVNSSAAPSNGSAT
jgi:hypothetical protein